MKKIKWTDGPKKAIKQTFNPKAKMIKKGKSKGKPC